MSLSGEILATAGIAVLGAATGLGLGLLLKKATGHRIESFLLSAAIGMLLMALLAILVSLLPKETFVARSRFLKQLLVTVIVSVFIVTAWSPRIK